jgi:hypothetical protein
MAKLNKNTSVKKIQRNPTSRQDTKRPVRDVKKTAKKHKVEKLELTDAEIEAKKEKARRYYILHRAQILAAQKERYAADPQAKKDYVAKWRRKTDDGKVPLYVQGKENGHAPVFIRLPRLNANDPVVSSKKKVKTTSKKNATVKKQKLGNMNKIGSAIRSAAKRIRRQSENKATPAKHNKLAVKVKRRPMA